MADAGYRAADGHPARRRAWIAHFAAGGTWICRICRLPITPGDPWDLGHGVAIIEGGDGADSQPEHRSCNRAAGGRLGSARRISPKASRQW